MDNVYVPAGVKVVKSYAFAECDKLKKITFAGTPNKLSRHAFDDCDQLHDIIVPVGSSKFFRKELHFIDGDTDYLVLEKADKKVEIPEKKADKKAETSGKKTETSEKKAKKEPAKVK